MGGYAGYIWSAYGITAILLIVLMVASRRMLRGNQKTLAALTAAQAENNRNETVEEKT